MPAMFRPAAAAALLVAAGAFAAEPKKPAKKPAEKAKPKARAEPMDLGLPSFGAIPNEQLNKRQDTGLGMQPSVTATSTSYEIVKVQHARSFARTPSGAAPMGGALASIALAGDPPMLEKFTTIVRVKCAQRMGAPIDVVVLDPRSDTVMSASGNLSFRGVTQDEVDYTVEWEATPARSAGDFQVLIKIASQPMGTFPLKVEKK